MKFPSKKDNFVFPFSFGLNPVLASFMSQKFLDLPAAFIRNHIPIIDATQPAHVDKCKYTISEDNHYVIGYYPGAKNVLVGGCGSGSGFKVAPGIGKVLSEMAVGEKPTIDVSFFSFDRFAKNS
ncbi:hypothetical protein ANCDUO_01629 [Ancylostoma duodenale]|uniref:FAD dependent oxidoreductase domain-containing protein n=1 Tax=Ancylostoma duodenale TaxID=51022 RepID=A0A0C2DYF5_9BILA|nr:hypothetical protein ANCDUO_01629 [Ancylostoma duodenale]